MRFLIGVVVFGLVTGNCFAHSTNKANGEDMKELDGFAWLKQFEGNWATEFNGTMNSRVIGEKWIVSEISFPPNGPFSVQTLGFDTETHQFIGTWVDASSNFIWRYKGSLDPTGKKLVLEAEGPDLSDPTTTRQYRDSYEFKSANEIVATSEMLNDEDQWQIFNTSKMTRIAD